MDLLEGMDVLLSRLELFVFPQPMPISAWLSSQFTAKTPALLPLNPYHLLFKACSQTCVIQCSAAVHCIVHICTIIYSPILELRRLSS